MAKKTPGRQSKYTRTVGEKPNQGRRYVENGRVRIEWHEDGKRRRRSFGENTAKARGEADAALDEMLKQIGKRPWSCLT